MIATSPVVRAAVKAGLSPSEGIVSTAADSSPEDETLKDWSPPDESFSLTALDPK